MMSTFFVGSTLAILALQAPATPPPAASNPGAAEDPSQATSAPATSAPPTATTTATIVPPVATSKSEPELPKAPVVEDGGPVTPEQPVEDPPSKATPMNMETPASGAPLPAPLPPVDPKKIVRGPWRGTAWFSFLGTVAFPFAGDEAARGDGLATLGGFFQAGLRPLPWLGIGVGVGTQPHQRLAYDNGTVTDTSYRRISFVDLPIVRFYLPTKSIVAPYAEVQGGVAFTERLSYVTSTVGGHAGVGVGIDIWVARNVSLALSERYRMIAIDGDVGHQMATFFGVTLHR